MTDDFMEVGFVDCDITPDIVGTILDACREIKNSRNLTSVFDHLVGEVHELGDEVVAKSHGFEQGEDGVLGESVDVMLCAIDAAYVNDPKITTDQIMEVVVKKLAKWKRLYGNA